ncbi:extensin-like, partial [Tupaia chinensis]|uniref:extensin-like n=1 Tax=Tupaia chinensis TaxID=246437 RepID=UPI00070406BB
MVYETMVASSSISRHWTIRDIEEGALLPFCHTSKLFNPKPTQSPSQAPQPNIHLVQSQALQPKTQPVPGSGSPAQDSPSPPPLVPSRGLWTVRDIETGAPLLPSPQPIKSPIQTVLYSAAASSSKSRPLDRSPDQDSPSYQTPKAHYSNQLEVPPPTLWTLWDIAPGTPLPLLTSSISRPRPTKFPNQFKTHQVCQSDCPFILQQPIVQSSGLWTLRDIEAGAPLPTPPNFQAPQPKTHSIPLSASSMSYPGLWTVKYIENLFPHLTSMHPSQRPNQSSNQRLSLFLQQPPVPSSGLRRVIDIEAWTPLPPPPSSHPYSSAQNPPCSPF